MDYFVEIMLYINWLVKFTSQSPYAQIGLSKFTTAFRKGNYDHVEFYNKIKEESLKVTEKICFIVGFLFSSHPLDNIINN